MPTNHELSVEGEMFSEERKQAKRKAELEFLLARVEAATGPDRELDEAIGVLFGWILFDAIECVYVSPEGKRGDMPCFTSSIDAAVALVERMLPGWKRGCGIDFIGPFGWVNKSPKDQFFARAKTEVLSILSALLRALIPEIKDENS